MGERLEWFTTFYEVASRPSKNSDNYDEWIYNELRHKKFRKTFAGSVPVIVDRKGEYYFNIKTSSAHPMVINYEWKDQGNVSLKDLMYRRAEELVSKDTEIQFFWSGGVDSTSCLLILKDVCPKDQLLVQMTNTSIEENPVMWEKFVKNLHHDIYTGHNLYLTPNPNKYVCVTCGTCDLVQNCFQRDAVPIGLPSRRWWLKVRFAEAAKRYRWHMYTKERQLNLSNICEYFDPPYIEQYFLNQLFEGKLRYWVHNPSNNDYLKAKPEMRDILREFDKDMGDNLKAALSIKATGTPLKAKDAPVVAITETGRVINKAELFKTIHDKATSYTDISEKLNNLPNHFNVR